MKERRSKEVMTAVATGDYEAIPWLDLHYDDWLWLQHFWQREKLGLEEDEPLAVALEALDRITRQALGSGNASYWIARRALDRLGLWPKDEEEAS
jgi:hypothetical protein